MAVISRTEPTLGPDHTGLVLFDTLHGYLHPTDPKKRAFLKEHKILPNMKRLLAGARKAGLTTFYPMGQHAADGSDTVARLTDTDMDLNPRGARKGTIKPRFHKGSKTTEIAVEVKPAKGDLLIPKQRWNSFFCTELELQLRARDISTIVLAGGSTDVGIASTAYAARDLDLGLVIVRDCCYSMRGNNNDFFMDRVFPRMGQVMTVDEVVKLMAAGAKKTKSRR
ncbi:MAG: ureidoacrylate peracid hydrolase [Alphaproteobacteria bacterium]|jgi:ureidoacrylate peracid hydrolase